MDLLSFKTSLTIYFTLAAAFATTTTPTMVEKTSIRKKSLEILFSYRLD
jgi:hypothetical protein